MGSVYVAIDGVDASGKTSVIREIGEILGDGVDLFRSPSSDLPIGRLIRQVFRGEVDIGDRAMMHLFSADALDQERLILESLCRNRNAVIDRHNMISALVYQSEVHGLDLVASAVPRDLYVRPDLLVLIDAWPQEAVQRLADRGPQETDSKYKTTKLSTVSARRKAYINAFKKLEHWPRRMLKVAPGQDAKSVATLVVDAMREIETENRSVVY